MMNKNIITTPICNVLNIDLSVYEKYANELIHLHTFVGKDMVSFHKRVLGKQDYCFTGEYKYWVWGKQPFENELGWRVYVSNKKGISIEVTPCDIDSAWALLEDYMKSIGFK